jgi:predicted transcriptional regulator
MTVSNMIELDSKLFKSISKIAKKENTTETKLINQMLETAVENKTKENKIPKHLLKNKDTYNPNHEKLMKSAGIIKTKKPFDTLKAIDEVKRDKEY